MSYSSRRTGGSAATSSSAQRKITTERNQQILRTLLKDPANKFCADCKTSGHPRWASWSLGIFVCIRCSGIHRSMGTHISKVRSIDLDSWSDEQVEPLVKWGNRRANVYWESKLPDGYVPDDGKIENFIRTKYEMKRWVLSPQLPDPANLDRSIDAEERVPLAEVQKRSAKTSRNGTVAPPHPHHTQPHLHQQTRQAPPKPAAPVHDLLGGDFAPQRSAPTTATQYSNVSSSGRAPHSSAKTPASLSQQAPSRYHHRPAETPQAQPQQPKQHQQPQQPSSSLIGLDFGPASSRAPQAAPATHAQPQQPQQTNTRPDLKKSILSLYSTPAPSYQQPQPQQQQFSAAPSTFDALSGFGNLSLNSHTAPKQNPTPSGNNLNDLLGGSFTSSSNSGSLHQPKPAPPKKTNAFDDLLGGPTSAWASPAASKPAAAQPTQYAPSHVSKPSYSSSPTPQYTSHNKKHSVNHTSASNDEEWADFTSHTSTIPTRSSGTQAAAAFNSTSPANPMDEDLFANVWK